LGKVSFRIPSLSVALAGSSSAGKLTMRKKSFVQRSRRRITLDLLNPPLLLAGGLEAARLDAHLDLLDAKQIQSCSVCASDRW
jgi:hypothetical protein